MKEVQMENQEDYIENYIKHIQKTVDWLNFLCLFYLIISIATLVIFISAIVEWIPLAYAAIILPSFLFSWLTIASFNVVKKGKKFIKIEDNITLERYLKSVAYLFKLHGVFTIIFVVYSILVFFIAFYDTI
jgi:hypothetical protein